MVNLINRLRTETDTEWKYVETTRNTYQDNTKDYIIFKIKEKYYLSKCDNPVRDPGEQRTFGITVIKTDDIDLILNYFKAKDKRISIYDLGAE